MKIVVCVKQVVGGELNPFDAAALEVALGIENAEITVVSMGREAVKDMLLGLTRLGNVSGLLLSDSAFAGADTLATGYALSLAIKGINPDLIICGRQTVDGDTAQTGPIIGQMLGLPIITNVMSINSISSEIECTTRLGDEKATLPALITVERIKDLRFPSIRSTVKEVKVVNADDLGADKDKCGLKGSPTRVVKSFENNRGKRKCTFITPAEFKKVVAESLTKARKSVQPLETATKLKNVWTIGEKAKDMALTVAETVTVIEPDTADNLAKKIAAEKPDFVLWASDIWARRTAPQVSAILKTGLCADCTMLETDGTDLFMYRPAFSGNIIAKIKCLTKPVMATVRTTVDGSDIVMAAGKGVRSCYDKFTEIAESLGADIAASRGLVDLGFAPYEQQVGLTGKTISPLVYIACGISGAVHHVVGMEQSNVIIAINPDKDAPIFEYADYGIVANLEDI